MILTKEFIESVKQCKTSEQISEKIKQAEEAISNLRKIRDYIAQEEVAYLTKQMIKHNMEY